MTSVSRQESRKATSIRRAVLMRSAATALIAVSPFAHSGAAAAPVADVQLTAPLLPGKRVVAKPLVHSLESLGGFQLNAPNFRAGKVSSLFSPSNFQLSAPILQGGATAANSSFASQPVQNLLAVPMDAEAGKATISSSTFAITPAPGTTTVDNSDDLTVSDAETAIDVDGGQNHVVVNNTGDLAGGGGINVTTGDFDLDAGIVNSREYSFVDRYRAPLYDENNNPVMGPCSWDPGQQCQVFAYTGNVDTTIILNDVDASQSDASITINNGGDIAFSGTYGIRAENQAGDFIDITNSGDITSTADTPRRVGIFADTVAPYVTVTDGPTEITPGEYTFNSEGNLTGVITEGQHEKTIIETRPVNDLGAISIINGGLIDMGVVDVSEIPPGYIPAYIQSEGIYARGFGGIEIVNQASATIRVGDFSNGITTVSAGDAIILNEGRIEIGNRSVGIYALAGSQPSGDLYSNGGDTTIINSGDIVGGLTKEEAAASQNRYAFGADLDPDTIDYLVGATGIRAYSLGTSVDGYGWLVEYVQTLQSYGIDVSLTHELIRNALPGHPQPPAELTDPAEIEEWWANFVPGLENFTTTIVNQGNIELKGRSHGIYATGMYGEIRAYNGGTINLGDGDSRFQQNFDSRSIGIYMNNFPLSGVADFYAKNEADGIIVTGDDGVGILLQTAGGSATAINEGSITVGNGGVGDHTNYGETYDWLFPSIGMAARTVGTGFGQTAIVANSGTITTGDLSIGMTVAGNNATFGIVLQPNRITAYAINEGEITTGNNAAGIVAFGNNVLVANTGSIEIGDRDLSGFDLPPDPLSASGQYFAHTGYGIIAGSSRYGTVYNNGSVTTGDNTVGIQNGARTYYGGLGITTIQGEDGVVETGDNSVGIRSHAGYVSILDNAGRISVGDNSTGVDMSAGFVGVQFISGPGNPAVVVNPGQVIAANSGIIETGDNSVGVRLQGVIEGAPYDSESYYVISEDPWSGEYRQYTGTVDILGEAHFQNTGTVRVGANSTAVEITGYGAYGINLYNVGTIDAGQGIALKINADTGIDSTILNGGTIIGDILLGDGDDLFLHAQNVDPETGQVLSTGNIIMDGHTIDFGGGENTFRIQRGVISVAGGDDNLITGDNLTLEMDYGEIDARDDFITGPSVLALAATPLSHTGTNFSTLTIDGDVSGIFRFATDVDSHGQSDELVITGNVADGSEIGVVLNLVEQLKGEVEWRPINIGGTNGADVIEVAGVSGLYADSFLGGEAHYDAASGDIVVNATFGLGHMGTAANAAAVGAGNWLASSLSSYGNRNIHAYTGRKGEGLAVWGYAFQDEGEIRPDSDLQDLSFRQITSGFQAGVQWSQDLWGGRVSVSPMATYGTAEANLIANTSSARSHPWAVGLNANYVSDAGFYVDATWQRMKMEVDLKTPGTVMQATGEADIDGQGFNLETGYSHKLKSGVVLEPQLQLTHVKLDMDDFATSDGIYSLSDIDGKATTLRAGVSVYKVFETSTGSITPLASLSYLNAINGGTELASNGVGFDSDTSGSGFKGEIGVLGRHNGWDFAGKLGLTKTSATGSILQPSLNVRYAFGADGSKAEQSAQRLPEVTEATVKYADAGNTAAPMAIAAPDTDGAAVVSASVALTGAEPVDEQDATEGQPAVEHTPEQESELATGEPAATDGEDIVVTGSLVQRGAPADIAPVTVVTAEDMATKGLLTLGDVMNSFTQNDGFTQGKASNLLGRFTHGAEEVNFRGLGTGRTLVLVNGRRIADYPLPFGGEQNGADLGAIPFSAIANVQYLSSGASATYGSDAVGGVVNIITKRDMEQTAVDLTAGIFQEGFGPSLRLSAITGNSFAKGSFTLGGEFVFSDEILASDSDYLRKNAPFEAGMVSLVENTASGMNPVVPQSACAPLGFEFQNGECVADVSETISLSPSYKKASAFFDGRYDLTDDIELFATGMAAKSWTEARSNVLFWQGVVGNNDGSAAMFITRGFSEDELGISEIEVDSTMLSGVLGAKGDFELGGRAWYWDIGLSSSWYDLTQSTMNLKEEGIRNWILAGASSVTDSPDQRYTYFVDPGFYNNQLVDNVIRPVQPSDVDSLVGENVMKANASATTLAATLNGEIGDLGFMYKPAKIAFRAEYGHQKTEINPDERSLNTSGEGWYNIGSIQSQGTRNRWAIAGEVDASILSNLDIMLAARYDHYDDASAVDGRMTGQAKFLYRPTDWLKIRGGYGQTFRAPDMFNIYGQTDAFEFVPDYSQPGCFDGVNYSCGFTQVASTRRADPNLTEEHGDDIGLGAIFNPIPNFTVTLDWYRIKLKDLVITESSADLMLKEWQCDNGVLDASSQLCADVHSRVIRNGFGAVERVIVQPINQDSLTRQGIDLRAQYRFESEDLGAFTFDLGYSKVLKFELNRFQGDEPLDLKYGEPGASQPGDGLSAGLSWYQPLTTGKAISAGVFVQRQGRVKNFDHSQFLEPFYDVNLTVGYQLNAKTSARFTVNNLLGADPVPNGSNIWPGYWAHLQSAFGRSFAISIGHSFN